MERRLQEASLAATFALAVGGVILYFIGTIAIASQLRDAGIDPLDGLGFFSISQILLRGIAVAVHPTAVVVLVILAFGAWIHRSHDDQFREPPTVWLRLYFVGSALLISALVLLIVLWQPVPAREAYLSILLVPAGFLFLAVRNERLIPNARWMAVVFICSWVVFLFLKAWLAPHPLPWIQLKLVPPRQDLRPPVISGDFVGYDSHVWYVQWGDSTHGYPANRVREATITSANLIIHP
ncbi:MAG: hypothetical protein QOF06_1013 [Solirubrobacterales bacterium]|jgi:hypothetical protein|nr:hypothetical protein [Solirubrobacterales bacterium]